MWDLEWTREIQHLNPFGVNPIEPVAASPGITRPPLVYLMAVLFGAWVDKAVPSKLPSDVKLKSLSGPSGLVILVSAFVFIVTRRQFRLANTPMLQKMQRSGSGPEFYATPGPIFDCRRLARIDEVHSAEP